MVGVSQPHIHNVLKGKRFFSLETADQVLQSLGVDVLDLIDPEEWNQRRPHR
jgi:transcriptional regulator with XRE-family HTH domain